MTILQDQTKTNEDVMNELARLRAENARLKDAQATKHRMKVSEKGALSIYGFGRFPVTLYKGQWLMLLAIADRIREFINAHADELKDKDD